MIQSRVAQRVQLLFNGGRYEEALRFLEAHLSDYPNDQYAKYCYATALLFTGDKTKSRQICEQLLVEDPGNESVLTLSANIDLDDDRYETAESKAELLVEIDPMYSDHHLLLGRVKMAQRSYDKALISINTALELDAENIEALNCKIMVDGLVGNKGTSDNIDQALELNPENPYTIANQANRMLQDGDVKGALDRAHYALSLNPSNLLAQSVLKEAMKSRFWPYKMFYKYQMAMSKLSGDNIWKVMIGVYVGYHALRVLAQSNEALGVYLTPIVYMIAGLFFLSWLMSPIMNLYLLSNKYGKVLLDDDDKVMAKLTGVGFGTALLCIPLAIWLANGMLFNLGIVGLLSVVMLGTFLHPKSDANRKKMKLYTIAAVVVGLIWVLTYHDALMYVFMLAVFAYQWIINGILIKENSRVFE